MKLTRLHASPLQGQDPIAGVPKVVCFDRGMLDL